MEKLGKPLDEPEHLALIVRMKYCYSVVLVYLSFFHGHHLKAQIITGNMATPAGVGGAAGSNNWFAQGFRTPVDAAYSLTNVTLRLSRRPAHQGMFSVNLWSSTSSTTPSRLLATLVSEVAVASLNTSFTDHPVAVVPPVPLIPGTWYFVVLTASADEENSGLLWADTATLNPGFTGPGEIGGWSRSLNQGGQWDPVELGFPFQMAISGPSVAAGPLLLNPHSTPEGFSFSIQTAQGRTYVVESTEAMNQAWSPVMTLTGDGTTMVVTDPTVRKQTFYRVRTQ